MKRVIIILCDTLRAKSLPHYGNERNTLPNLIPIIDRDFIVYNRAYAPASWTIPSHLSLFTGLYPTQVMEAPTSFRLNAIFKTLPVLFKDSGYKTFGATSNVLISKRFGFDRGFDEFLQLWLPNPKEEEILLDLKGTNDFERALKIFMLIAAGDNKRDIFRALRQKIFKRFKNIVKDTTPFTKRAMSLLKQYISGNNEQSLFCFVNLMQTHQIYTPPRCTRNTFVKYNAEYENLYKNKTVIDHYASEPFSKSFMDYLKLRYEEEILYLDIAISDFIKFLKRNSLYDESIIIITSDHGEHFGENGHFTHWFSVYEPLIRIPLYIKWAGKSENDNKVKDELVMLQDLYTTFLNLLDHWQPPPDSSVDLNSSDKRSWILSQLPDMSFHIRECFKKRRTFSIKEIGLNEDNLAAYVFNDGTKIIENGSKILCYNLKNDSEETKPYQTSDDKKKIVERIKNTIA
jgi:arylsulfatase A-like enzyme